MSLCAFASLGSWRLSRRLVAPDLPRFPRASWTRRQHERLLALDLELMAPPPPPPLMKDLFLPCPRFIVNAVLGFLPSTHQETPCVPTLRVRPGFVHDRSAKHCLHCGVFQRKRWLPNLLVLISFQYSLSPPFSVALPGLILALTFLCCCTQFSFASHRRRHPACLFLPFIIIFSSSYSSVDIARSLFFSLPCSVDTARLLANFHSRIRWLLRPSGPVLIHQWLVLRPVFSGRAENRRLAVSL